MAGTSTPWFEFPLDFSREDTQHAETLLIQAYSSKPDACYLAENVGLDLSLIDTDGPVRRVWREVLRHAAKSGRLVRLVAAVLQDPSKRAAAEILAGLMTGHESRITAAILDYKPSVAALAAAPPAIQFWASGAGPTTLAGQLEKVIHAAAGFSDVPEFLRGLVEAQVRTARILAGGQPTGTGFLVGDSLLLTNWHVVARADASLVAQFDYNSATQPRDVAFAADWKVATSEHAPVGEELGGDGPGSGRLDFALVRLAEPVGKEPLGTRRDGEPRGHLTLPRGDYAFVRDEPILIVGHPRTRPLQLSYACPSSASVTKHGTRVRYTTNTEGGSSGSPVFNKDWRLVALHHAGGPTREPDLLAVPGGQFNQGVPIALIVQAFATTVTDGVREELGIV